MISEHISVAKYEVETVLALLASGHQDVMHTKYKVNSTIIFQFLWHVHPPKGVLQIPVSHLNDVEEKDWALL